MPCLGPTPAECAVMEANENWRKYGIQASDLDIATRVACHLAKGESNQLTKKWIKEHNKLDAARAAAEEERYRRENAEAEIERVKKEIYKKHGL